MGRFLSANRVSAEALITAPAAYQTPSGTFVAFKGSGQGCTGLQRKITALKVSAGSPPSVSVAWCAGPQGQGSPIVTNTGNNAETIVWYVAAEGDNRLRGFNGETGAVVFNGGGAGDAMSGVTRFQTPIVAKGRIFVAGNSEVYAFSIDGAGGTPSVTPSTPATGNELACTNGYRSFGETFFKNYCVGCHGASTQIAGVQLDTLDGVTANPNAVIALAGNPTASRMPPATSKQPTAAERAQLATWLETCK
jgi:hypothetical protein